MGQKLAITLRRSVIGKVPRHRGTIKALGLRRIHQTVVLPDSPAVPGMIKAVEFMVRVRECEE
ncbi:MAG TPA: 50S ribosomal protein L30 [bacterium]|nr:50S ribosomal protein L30 [bacterium]